MDYKKELLKLVTEKDHEFAKLLIEQIETTALLKQLSEIQIIGGGNENKR